MKHNLRSLVFGIGFCFSFYTLAAPQDNTIVTLLQVAEEYQQLSNAAISDSKVISSAWHQRYPKESRNGLQTLSYKQLVSGSNALAFPEGMKLNNLHISHDRLAILRFDNIPASDTAFLIALKEADGWKVVADLRADSSCAKHVKTYSHEEEHKAVLDVLGVYYSAVTEEQAEMLDPIFHKDWYMKNHENGVAVFEGVDAFKKRLQGDRHGTYNAGREISDVQIVNQCIALVRIDNPLSNGNTFFVFYKQGENWLITDKLWTSPAS